MKNPIVVKIIKETLATSTDQLWNEVKAERKFQDWEQEEYLKKIIPEYKKWVNRVLGKPIREHLMKIIKDLEKELADVRSESNTHPRRTVGHRIGKNKQKNGNARDTDTVASKAIPQPFRAEKKRIYRLGRSPQ